MSDPTEKILARLPAEQLEFLAELADELEPDGEDLEPTYLSSRPISPGLQLLAAAKKLADEQQPLRPYEKEWNHELGREMTAAYKKSGRRLPAVLTTGEALGYLESAKDNERDYVMVHLFYSTGMRLGEVDQLLVADIYFDADRILVRDGKYNTDRYVLMDPKTCDLLAKWCYPLKENDQVFDLGRRQISRRVKEIAKSTQLYDRYRAMDRHFSPHSLRHSMATHLYEGGMDIFALQQLLGHKYLSTTRDYVRIGVGLLLDRYRAAHPLCRAKR